MSKRSCEELGVCQSARPCPLVCSHAAETLPPGGFWFAPGTIEGAPADQQPLSLGETLVVYARWAVALATLCAIVIFSLGYFSFPKGLL